MAAEQANAQAEATISAMLAAAPAAQEVWSATLDLMEGLVAMAIARGWCEHHARTMVVHRFLNGV